MGALSLGARCVRWVSGSAGLVCVRSAAHSGQKTLFFIVHLIYEERKCTGKGRGKGPNEPITPWMKNRRSTFHGEMMQAVSYTSGCFKMTSRFWKWKKMLMHNF